MAGCGEPELVELYVLIEGTSSLMAQAVVITGRDLGRDHLEALHHGLHPHGRAVHERHRPVLHLGAAGRVDQHVNPG